MFEDRANSGSQEIPTSKQFWTSLEIAKLAVSILTVVIGALLVHRLTLNRDQHAWDLAKNAATEARREARITASQVAIDTKNRILDERDNAKKLRDEDRIRAAAAAIETRDDARKQIAFNSQLAFARERALQSEAFVTERAIRAEGAANEDRVRREMAEEKYESGLIDRRLKIWQEVGPKINDIYVYIVRVGRWKELSSTEIVRLKREIDRSVFTYKAFFSESWLLAYQNFMNAAFDTYAGSGTDAKLRTSIAGRPLDRDASAFSPNYSDEAFERAHEAFQRVTSEQVGARSAVRDESWPSATGNPISDTSD